MKKIKVLLFCIILIVVLNGCGYYRILGISKAAENTLKDLICGPWNVVYFCLDFQPEGWVRIDKEVSSLFFKEDFSGTISTKEGEFSFSWHMTGKKKFQIDFLTGFVVMVDYYEIVGRSLKLYGKWKFFDEERKGPGDMMLVLAHG